MIFLRIAVLLAAAGIAIYTASYGRWEWQHGNRSGAAAVWLLAIAAAALPVIRFFG